MTQLQISALLLLNTAMLVALIVIAFRLSQGYNVLVKRGANHTTAPIRVDTIELKLSRNNMNAQRDILIRSGYSVSRSTYSEGVFTLIMTKPIDGTTIRRAGAVNRQ